jgi:hypothetical protein
MKKKGSMSAEKIAALVIVALVLAMVIWGIVEFDIVGRIKDIFPSLGTGGVTP